jgi:Transposase and inactivated derivatives, IS30 family
MKKWKHINFEQRKAISSGISHEQKIKYIGLFLGIDPTSISKEVKRNRILVDPKMMIIKPCNKLDRWPFVCSNCKYRYKECRYTKYRYDAKSAQNLADSKLINSRNGLDVNDEEFKNINQLIKTGVDNNKSIFQIKVENKDVLNKSITTLYRYINKGYLTTRKIDLPYAVKYKKRKQNKKYEYTDNKIDRSNHTYLDYLSYLHKNPGVKVWQLDFLGSIKSDSKSILTFIMPEIQLTLIDIITEPNSDKVVKFFDELEERIGTEAFIHLIPVILTDRDPCFSDILGICFSKITGEERCKLFFCDPYVSSQKPHVENMNKQLRLYFPKKGSIDRYSKQDIHKINYTMLNKPLRSLDSNTPTNAFIAVYGEDLFNKLFK